MVERKINVASPKDLQHWSSYDHYNIDNPHVGDPRNLQFTQWNYCRLRYALFCRCCRELSEDNPRCRYQYYRAEMACTQDFLDIANKYREQGNVGLLLRPPSLGFQFETMKASCNNIVKSVNLIKGLDGRVKLSLARHNALNWHLVEPQHHELIVDFLHCCFGEDWDMVKGDAYWGINAITQAIEGDCDIALHIPLACSLKAIPYVSLINKVKLPSSLPVKNLSAVAIKRACGRLEVLKAVITHYNHI